MPTRSLEGYRYRIDAVCHGATWGWIGGMANRTQQNTVEFLRTLVERLRNCRELRCDNAREFIGGAVGRLCAEERIEWRRTEAYVHDNAGKVERMHQAIAHMVRPMLLTAGLPASFWFLASAAAVHIRNRMPTRANKDQLSPYEARFGVVPNVSHIKAPFGCLTYSSISSPYALIFGYITHQEPIRFASFGMDTISSAFQLSIFFKN